MAKKLIILIIILIIFISGLYFYRQIRINHCKGECWFSPPRESTQEGYWNWINHKVFDTQKQCIDYCFGQQ